MSASDNTRSGGLELALRPLFLILVLLLVGRHAVLALRTIALTDPVDLSTYYVHARMLWEGANPADAAALDEYARRLGLKALRGMNPPTFYFLFLPFALLPWTAAKALWMLLSQAALAGIGWISWREMARQGLPRGESALGVAGFLTVFYPAKQALALGQMDVFLGLGAAGMGLALARRRDAWVAVLALLMGWMKIQLGAVLVFLLWMGRARRGLWAAAILGLIWLGGTAAALGPQSVAHYLGFLRDHLGGGLNADAVNYGLNGLLARVFQPLTGPAAAVALCNALTAAIAAAAFWILWGGRRSREKPWLETGFLLLSVWMLSPLSEEHHLAWLIAPLLLTAADPELREGRLQAGFFLAALLLIGVEHYPHAIWKGPGFWPELLRSSKFFGPLVLWILAGRALLGLRRKPGGTA